MSTLKLRISPPPIAARPGLADVQQWCASRNWSTDAVGTAQALGFPELHQVIHGMSGHAKVFILEERAAEWLREFEAAMPRWLPQTVGSSHLISIPALRAALKLSQARFDRVIGQFNFPTGRDREYTDAEGLRRREVFFIAHQVDVWLGQVHLFRSQACGPVAAGTPPAA